MRRRCNSETREAPDDGSVDAYVLKVGTDSALEFHYQALLLPPIDLILDEFAEFRAVLHDENGYSGEYLLVDPRSYSGIRIQGLAERAHHLHYPPVHTRVRSAQVALEPLLKLGPQLVDVSGESAVANDVISY